MSKLTRRRIDITIKLDTCANQILRTLTVITITNIANRNLLKDRVMEHYSEFKILMLDIHHVITKLEKIAPKDFDILDEMIEYDDLYDLIITKIEEVFTTY